MSLAHVPRRSLLALTLAAACWGTGTVISRRAVAEIPPLTLLAVQLAASLFALVVLMRLRGIAMRDPDAPSNLGRLGLLNPGLAYLLSLVGLSSITASLSVLLWATEPILILILAAFVLGERIRPAVVALSGAAVGGVLLVLYAPGGGGAAVGVALTIAGVVCCAAYTVISRRWLGSVGETAPIVIAQQAYAFAFALGVLAIAAILGGPVLPETVSTLGWLSAAVSGVLYYGAAYWCYLSALRHMPASTAAASFYLIPVFGLAGGMILLGERLAATQWLGAAVVLGAVFVILRRTEGAETARLATPAPAHVTRSAAAPE
jgi:drug/metabolite transporter (DMT)-like permease